MTGPITLATPLTLEYLLHCYTSRSPFRGWSNDPQKAAADFLLRWGAIEPDGELDAGPIYKTTAKGEAWIRLLLSTPIPREAFADAQGRLIPQLIEWTPE